MATLKITNYNGELASNRKCYQFSASLPERQLLCGFVCSVQLPPFGSIYKDLEHSWRIAKTRSLVRDFEAFLAAPIQYQSSTQVTVVCSRKFYESGEFENLIVQSGFKFDYAIDHILDATMKTVLQFTVLARLSPLWNTVLTGFLMYGPYFLTNGNATPTVKLDVSVHGNTAKLNVQAMKMKIPHLQIADLEIQNTQVVDFATKVVQTVTADQFDLEWVYTLPTLRQGRVVTVSHKVPPKTPFKTYSDFHKMWFDVYGYYLPLPSDDEESPSPAGPYVTVKYTSVNSNAVDATEYTFPALCVRPYQPVFCRNVDQNAIIGTFLTSFKQCITTFCEFPFELQGSQLAKLTGSSVHNQQKPSASTSKSTADDDVSDIVASIRLQQNLKSQQLVLMAQQSVAQSDEFLKGLESRPKSAPGFVLNNVEALTIPQAVTPGLQQVYNFAPAPVMSQYMTNMVPVAPAAYMNPNAKSFPARPPRRKSAPATADQNNPKVCNVIESNMRPTSAFFASSVSQPTASTSSLPSHPVLKRSASFSGKGKGFWPIPAKKCAIDVDALDMASMVYRGRVGTLSVQTLKDWLNKVKVPYSCRYRKEELVQVVVNFIRSLEAMPMTCQPN